MVSFPCTCPPDMQRSSHHIQTQLNFRRAAHRSTYMFFFEALMQLLTATIHGFSHGHILMRLDRVRRSSHWPTSIEEILPRGPEDTMHGLMWWLTVDGAVAYHRQFFEFTDCLFRFTWPLTLPYIITSTTHLKGVIAVCHHISDQFDGAIRRGTPDAPGERDPRPFTTLLRGASSAFHVANSLCNYGQRRKMLRSRAEPLLVAVHRVTVMMQLMSQQFRIHDQDEYWRINESLMCLAWLLMEDFPHLKSVVAIHPSVQESLDAIVRPTIWKQTLSAIRDMTYSQKCASRDCVKTLLDYWPFKNCGRCRRVAYCSEECQRAAWIHSTAPHRALCSMIRSLCSTCGLTKLNLTEMVVRESPMFRVEMGQKTIECVATQTRYELATLRTLLLAYESSDGDFPTQRSTAQRPAGRRRWMRYKLTAIDCNKVHVHLVCPLS